MKDVHGWAFPDTDEFMAKELKADGTYQPSHLRTALTYVTDFSVAIDGGAHVGTWSKLLAAQFTQVIAFEPNHLTAMALRENMRTFGCGNVQILPMALGDRARTVTLRLEDDAKALSNTGAYHVGDLRAGHHDELIPMVTIDSLSVQSLGFLKLDVEGSELAALHGGSATIARCRPIVLFENKGLWRRHFGAAKEAPQDWLTNQGYRQLAKTGCDVIWGPV